MLLAFYPYNCTLFPFFFFSHPKKHTGQMYQVPLVRSYHFRNEFAICSIAALGSDHEFLTSTGPAFEQNLREGGWGVGVVKWERESEQKDEEEKQNKSKAAFLVTPTSQRPSVKGPGL